MYDTYRPTLFCTLALFCNFSDNKSPTSLFFWHVERLNPLITCLSIEILTTLPGQRLQHKKENGTIFFRLADVSMILSEQIIFTNHSIPFHGGGGGWCTNTGELIKYQQSADTADI